MAVARTLRESPANYRVHKLWTVSGIYLVNTWIIPGFYWYCVQNCPKLQIHILFTIWTSVKSMYLAKYSESMWPPNIPVLHPKFRRVILIMLEAKICSDDFTCMLLFWTSDTTTIVRIQAHITSMHTVISYHISMISTCQNLLSLRLQIPGLKFITLERTWLTDSISFTISTSAVLSSSYLEFGELDPF